MITTRVMAKSIVIASLAMPVSAKSFAIDNVKFEDLKHSIRVALSVHTSGPLEIECQVSFKSVPYICMVQ